MSARYDLYVITDEGLSRGLTHIELARRAVEGGADVIQLRDKKMSGGDLFLAASEMRDICRKAGALFIVNDRLDIALASGADGVHLGQNDLPVGAARRIVPEGFIIGVSVSSAEQAVIAERNGADYVGFGPVFPTSSKADAGEERGFAELARVRRSVRVPVVAIGGINEGNAAEVVRAGADGISVISAVVSQEDVSAAAARLKALIAKVKAGPLTGPQQLSSTP
ncbi:thiamine phosphate synthase [Methanomassiliicoccus luminyensis]|uniref:thiamine phosphate synthase n=1 Tax=Methanomassiliicoccus luminyensis TaxID=1080712 RepID=UPI000372A4F7|nr:thiamine phosphate synthase [Methanomassiliicoccus luminyensis]